MCFGATLLTVLAALALVLTALGVHAVLAYTVQQRRREIGIRVALGARPAQVSRLVMAQGVAPVIAGLVIGVAGAIGLSRFVAGFRMGVATTDPMTRAEGHRHRFARTAQEGWTQQHQVTASSHWFTSATRSAASCIASEP